MLKDIKDVLIYLIQDFFLIVLCWIKSVFVVGIGTLLSFGFYYLLQWIFNF